MIGLIMFFTVSILQVLTYRNLEILHLVYINRTMGIYMKKNRETKCNIQKHIYISVYTYVAYSIILYFVNSVIFAFHSLYMFLLLSMTTHISGNAKLGQTLLPFN